MAEYETSLKIIITGDASAGKTSLIQRFACNEFKEDYRFTMSIDVFTKDVIVDGRTIRLQIWDTAGQEKFRAITKSYYRNSNGIIIVYDIADDLSFTHATHWLSSAREALGNSVPIMLVGNKLDNEENRSVQRSTGEEMARTNNILFMEVSAKTDQNVTKCFEDMSREIATLTQSSIVTNSIGLGEQSISYKSSYNEYSNKTKNNITSTYSLYSDDATNSNSMVYENNEREEELRVRSARVQRDRYVYKCC